MGHYAKEKFGTAIYSLATGRGDIRERLFDAYLKFHTLNEDDFPADLKSEWESLQSLFVVKEPTLDGNNEPVRGRVQNTLDSLSIDECVELAIKIWNLNFDIRSNDR